MECAATSVGRLPLVPGLPVWPFGGAADVPTAGQRGHRRHLPNRPSLQTLPPRMARGVEPAEPSPQLAVGVVCCTQRLEDRIDESAPATPTLKVLSPATMMADRRRRPGAGEGTERRRPSASKRTERRRPSASKRHRASERVGERAPNQRVDLSGLDLVHATHRIGDLPLVRARVHNENQCVVVLYLLHGRLSREWVLEDCILIKRVGLGDRLARVLGLTLQLQRLWAVELGRVPLGYGALPRADSKRLGRLFGLVSLLGFGLRARVVRRRPVAEQTLGAQARSGLATSACDQRWAAGGEKTDLGWHEYVVCRGIFPTVQSK